MIAGQNKINELDEEEDYSITDRINYHETPFQSPGESGAI